jgi:hypothetical protein
MNWKALAKATGVTLGMMTLVYMFFRIIDYLAKYPPYFFFGTILTLAACWNIWSFYGMFNEKDDKEE